MTAPHPLAPLADLTGVADAVAAARDACEELRWHRGLRRGWAVARTEAGVRAARAGLALDGVPVPVALVRDVARGAVPPPPGPEGDRVLGALRLQAEVERRMTAPGAPRRGRGLPAGQVLARLHAAAAGSVADAGRPRSTADDAGRGQGVAPVRVGPVAGDVDGGRGTDQARSGPAPGDVHGELRGLGPAPSGTELRARLALLQDLLDRPLPPEVPAVVLGAVVLGEVLVLRPFAEHNAVVARGLLRWVLTREGVDPVGVVVPEVAWADAPLVHVATAARFATGDPDGVAAWLAYVADAVVRGAREGEEIAAAVVAGRLTTSS